MGKFNYRLLTDKQQRDLLNVLAEVLVALKNKKDIQEFLEQLLTPSEVVMLARRLHIADALIHGKTYDAIRQKLGVGHTTILLVDRWLKGAIGDYRDKSSKYLKKVPLKTKKQSSGRHKSDMPGSLADVRHRYPQHFLLVNLLLEGLDSQ